MSFYPTLLRKILMPVYEAIKRKNLLQYLDEYESHLSWTQDELKQHQWHELKKLLNHAFNNTDFYVKHWAKAGIHSVDDIKCMADFARLPVVNKTDIAQHYHEFLASNYTNNIKKSTGGSTGQPLHFEYNVDSNTRREAVMWRGYGWGGYSLGMKSTYLWSVNIGEFSYLKNIKENLYHSFYNRSMLNLFNLKEDNINTYVDSIIKRKPQVIVSYVAPLYEVAKYINNHQITMPKLGSILTGAEPLLDFQRDEIEHAFKCTVINTYGCREFMLMASECQQEKNLHINSDHLIFETVDEQNKLVLEKVGNVLVTDLFNYGMPLIRYENGDRATLTNDKCGCGNPFPLIKEIDGRKPDVIKTPSGGMINGIFFPHLFKEFNNIKRFQVIQKKLDALTIKLIVDDKKTFQYEQSKLEIEINKYTNNELTLNFLIVDDIPLTPSGKHRVTICEI